MQASKSGGRPKDRRTLTRLTTLGVVALAAAAVATPTANSTIGPAGVAPGHNITVFHNVDFVAVFGNAGNLTVDVIRGGQVIGRAAGPAVNGDEGLALEVNHGVEPPATAGPGDCWIGHAPDVAPGDLIRVTNNDTEPPAIDEVVVDDITFSGPAFMETVPGTPDPITGVTPQEETGNIHVQGIARYSDGLNTPIPIAALDSSEFRDGQFRGEPDDVVRTPGTTDGFTMIYEPPYDLERNRAGLNEAQRKQSLLTSGGHATGFGHTEVLPLESMLVDGIDDAPGPAPGCEGEVKNSIISADDDAVNTTSDTLVLNGGRLADAGIPQVTVSDSDATTPDIGPIAATTVGGAWDLTVPRADLESLVNGELTVTAAFAGAGDGQAADETLKIEKATVGPPAATANPPAGTYVGAQSVSLTGQSVKYSTNGDPANLAYNGPIALGVGTTTINTSTTDAAGNVTERSFTYVITAPVAATPVAQAVQVIAPALAPRAPRVSLKVARSSYRLAGSTRLRSARRNGVRVLYSAPAGADRMRFTVYRSAGASARRALVKRTVRVRPGLRSVALKWRGMRAGRYVLEVRALKGGRAGKVSKRNFRIAR
jgi:Chitobiase/beta-hexosaminidase C-terminal domain